MITRAQCKRIIDLATAHGKGECDGIEVTISASDLATSRFANNEMTQNQSPYAVAVSVRAVVDGRQARISANDTTPAGVRRLVDNAIVAARLLEKDPELLPLYSPSAAGHVCIPVNQYDARTARCGASERARAVAAIIAVARASKLNASGVFATGSHVTAIGNSEGLFGFHRRTEAECSITMTGPDSSGWSKDNQTRASLIDARSLAEIAAKKARASANPIEIPAGRYDGILEPAAVLDLLGFLWQDFTGTSVTDKLSCFLDKVGQKMLGDNITIVDDVTNQAQAGEPFDGEGLPRKTIVLVENGVIANLVHGRRSAARFGVQPTGHGLPEPSTYGEAPLNVVVSGGNTSLDEMIRTSEKAILLTRVWYVREVDPMTKIVTGMTRDGTFLVENGKVTAGVKNLRFNVSLIDMLNKVVALGRTQRTSGEETYPAVVPAMKVADFNFASTTRF